jgi:hypothetical protein
MASTQPSSNNETSHHHSSEDFAGDTFFWNDLSPTSPCLSGDQLLDDNLWSGESEEMILGNSKPDSAYQLPLSEGVGLIISLASQSIWDSVDEEEDSGFTSCDGSPPLASGPGTGVVGLTHFPSLLMNDECSSPSRSQSQNAHLPTKVSLLLITMWMYRPIFVSLTKTRTGMLLCCLASIDGFFLPGSLVVCTS